MGTPHAPLALSNVGRGTPPRTAVIFVNRSLDSVRAAGILEIKSWAPPGPPYGTASVFVNWCVCQLFAFFLPRASLGGKFPARWEFGLWAHEGTRRRTSPLCESLRSGLFPVSGDAEGVWMLPAKYRTRGKRENKKHK